MNIKLVIASALIIISHYTTTNFKSYDFILPLPNGLIDESLTKLREKINHNEKQIFKQLSENLTAEQKNELENLIFTTFLLSNIVKCVERNPNDAGIFLNCFADENRNFTRFLTEKSINNDLKEDREKDRQITRQASKEISEILS